VGYDHCIYCKYVLDATVVRELLNLMYLKFDKLVQFVAHFLTRPLKLSVEVRLTHRLIKFILNLYI